MALNRIYRKKELPAIVGIKFTTIETMVANGEFPRPLRLSEKCVGWRENDIDAWLANRPLAGPAAKPVVKAAKAKPAKKRRK